MNFTYKPADIEDVNQQIIKKNDIPSNPQLLIIGGSINITSIAKAKYINNKKFNLVIAFSINEILSKTILNRAIKPIRTTKIGSQ